MEAVSTSVTFYHTIWRYKPEDSHLHTRRRENLNLTTLHSFDISVHWTALATYHFRSSRDDKHLRTATFTGFKWHDFHIKFHDKLL
jgi:hypothetical protein